MKKSIIVVCLSLFIAILGTISSASAAIDYPSKPIILIVPYGPGGSTDLAARAIAATVPKYLGQGIIVDNKPGASGQIGRQYTLQSKPDGYTMHMLAIGSGVMTPALNPTLPIKWEAFTYVAITQFNPIILVVQSKSNIMTFQDFVKELKDKPGKLKFSSSGPGSSESAGAHILLKAIGLGPKGAIEIPFDSAAESTGALLGGHVDFQFQTNPTVVPQIQAGKLRALAVTTKERLPYMKDVPTTAQLGYPQLDVIGFRGIIGPPNLPDYVVNAWDQALQKVSKDKAWISILDKFGDEPGYIGPKEAKAFVEKEFKRYRELFTELGILVK